AGACASASATRGVRPSMRSGSSQEGNMPDWTREIRGRLSMVRLSPAREAEVVEELNAHLEERWRELVAGGAPADEATRTVRTELAASDMLARRISTLRQARWGAPPPPAAAPAFSSD